MLIKLASITLMFLVGALWLTSGAVAQEEPVTAEIKNASGEVIGSVRAELTAGTAHITGDVHGLPPGAHGLHVHAAGSCVPPDFASAGGHYNPEGKQHGPQNPQGPHAGDLPNLEVGSDGAATIDATFQVSASVGAPNGAALVIHANPDDEITDPTGNSGARIACAVLAPAPATPAAPAPALPSTGSGGYLGDGGTPVVPVAVALGGFLALALAAAGRKLEGRHR